MRCLVPGERVKAEALGHTGAGPLTTRHLYLRLPSHTHTLLRRAWVGVTGGTPGKAEKRGNTFMWLLVNPEGWMGPASPPET